MTREQREAINGLREVGFKTLYIAECYITDLTAQASTNLWFVYTSIEEALGWVNACELYHKTHISNPGECTRQFTYKTGDHEIEERYVITTVA